MDNLEFLVSNLGGMGVVAWALYHTLARTIPRLTAQFVAELRAIRQTYEARDRAMVAALNRLADRVAELPRQVTRSESAP